MSATWDFNKAQKLGSRHRSRIWLFDVFWRCAADLTSDFHHMPLHHHWYSTFYSTTASHTSLTILFVPIKRVFDQRQ